MRGRAGRGAVLVARGVVAAGPPPPPSLPAGLRPSRPGRRELPPGAARAPPASRAHLGLRLPSGSRLVGAGPAALLQQTLLAA